MRKFDAQQEAKIQQQIAEHIATKGITRISQSKRGMPAKAIYLAVRGEMPDTHIPALVRK